MPPHPAASQIVPPAPPAPQSAPAWSAQPGMPPTPVAGHQPPPYAGPAPMGPGPAPAFPGQPMQHGYGPSSGGPSLDEVALIRKARRAPSRGWRRAVHTLSAGAINPGESQGDIEYQQLLERVNRPVRGDYRIAVLSLKGGVGKTTTTVGLGSTFASLRGDRVIAVDANPDLGTLAQRIPQQTRSTVRDLLADENVYRYSDVRAHTSQAPSRLEVLASERDPAMAEAFNEEEYRGVITVLQRFYNIIITDCGTGLSHSAMNGVLDLANTIILVSSPALDGARTQRRRDPGLAGGARFRAPRLARRGRPEFVATRVVDHRHRPAGSALPHALPRRAQDPVRRPPRRRRGRRPRTDVEADEAVVRRTSRDHRRRFLRRSRTTGGAVPPLTDP